MKKIIFSVLLIASVFSIPFVNTMNTTSAYATQSEIDIYNLINDCHLDFYEKYIAKEKVVSNISPRKLEKLSQNYGISADKLRKVITIQHALLSMNKHYTINEILELNTHELIILAKTYNNYLTKSMTPEELAQLKADFIEFSKKYDENKHTFNLLRLFY